MLVRLIINSIDVKHQIEHKINKNNVDVKNDIKNKLNTSNLILNKGGAGRPLGHPAPPC